MRPRLLDKYKVYMLFRPDGRPMYVGITRQAEEKRYKQHLRQASYFATYKDRVIVNAIEAGLSIPFVIVRERLSQKEAFALEVELIRIIGKEPDGPLLNSSVGGEGDPKHNSGWKVPSREEAIRRARLSSLGRIAITDGEQERRIYPNEPMPAGWCRGRSASAIAAIRRPRAPWSQTGIYKHSAEVRSKMKKSWPGRPDAVETRQRLGVYSRGKHWFTNGADNQLAVSLADLPPGWYRGRSL